MNAGRYSAACHEAGHAIVASSLGLQVGALWASDDGSGGTDISSAGHLLLVEQLAICLAGHQAQALTDCQIFSVQSFSDHVCARDILSANDVAEGRAAIRLRIAAREKAHGILKPRHDLLIEIANELMPNGQLSAERMAALLGSQK